MDFKYWIWLQNALGTGKELYEKMSYFGSAKGIYEAGAGEWKISGLFTSQQISKMLKSNPDDGAVNKIIKQCKENNWNIITPESEDYPVLLRRTKDFPAVLYVHGDLSFINNCVPLAMVGTRDASHYGYEATNRLSTALVKAGAVIISGGAMGVDSEAHSAALEAGGKTVAVLGSGLGINYPAKNAALRDKISRYGALVTELPPFTEPRRTTFPVRNRIISGMSLGTIVVEAGERSGSLITASLAGEQGRDVFAVPGSITESSFAGANKLIHDGAKPVFTAIDILEEYMSEYSETLDLKEARIPLTGASSTRVRLPDKSGEENILKKAQKIFEEERVLTEEPPEELTETAKRIYSALKDGAMHVDEITSKTKLLPSEVLVGLTELELCEIALLTSGRKYALNISKNRIQLK